MNNHDPSTMKAVTGPAEQSSNTVLPYAPDTFYCIGDVVYQDGALYRVTVNYPRGVPGQSDDFALIASTGPSD